MIQADSEIYLISDIICSVNGYTHLQVIEKHLGVSMDCDSSSPFSKTLSWTFVNKTSPELDITGPALLKLYGKAGSRWKNFKIETEGTKGAADSAAGFS